MTTKNKDYSGSAVNLCNPYQVREALQILKRRQDTLEKLYEESEDMIPQELKDNIKLVQKTVAEAQTLVHDGIELYGSYQDVEAGIYGVCQRRRSVIYLPDKVKANLPKYAPAVIEEMVNKKAFEGLIKGGLITEEQARDCSEEKETFAYIIETGKE